MKSNLSLIFKSQKINLDPEPYVNPQTGERSSVAVEAPEPWFLDPRPEFEPTRDPNPWLISRTPNGEVREAHGESGLSYFDPRREQFDTPVNPILSVYRLQHRNGVSAAEMLAWMEAHPYNFLPVPTDDQIEHARKVLTRLANYVQ